MIKKNSFIFKAFNLKIIFVITAALSLTSCQKVSDLLRNWGITSRQRKEKKISAEEMERWKRDLKISEDRVHELHKDIHQIVQETNLQGMLSWKIAKAYMEDARYDMAAEYFEGAVNNSLPDRSITEKSRLFDKAIPYFEKALKMHRIEPELLFDAGLCYANASKSQGWEVERWKTAVYLFSLMKEMKPDDLRPNYQLALLYGFTSKKKYKDQTLAMDLLQEIIKKEETNVSARFVIANLFVQKGDLDSAREEYIKISEVIEDMHSSGMISGPVSRNRKYLQARENIEKLDDCLEGRPSCEIYR
ncbi:MAG: hypothetical protein OEZ34_16975 [Spirochaetia bacterium]|nr:hypothetical protein [Spirochaetia bacterium]